MRHLPIMLLIDGYTDEEQIISQAVRRICSSFRNIQRFPADSKTWLIEKASKGVSGMLAYNIYFQFKIKTTFRMNLFLGIRSIAEKFADDEKGHFGCKKASEETKKRIVGELMKEDKLGNAVRKAISQLPKNGSQNGGDIAQNFYSKGILLAFVGVMGYILRASMNDFEQVL